MCRNATVLIVEDEALIALDLAMAVEDAGGHVLGPASTTTAALALIAEAFAANDPVTAAILDGTLADRDVAPVVERLHECGVPMIIYSAVGLPGEVRALASLIPWIRKPALAQNVVAKLTQLIAS